MADAAEILFDTPINGRALFKKQLELVQELLNTLGSSYYVDPERKDLHEREQIRLKTLVSQLLSPNVCRNIPSEFADSLKIVINKKTEDEQLSEQLVRDVIADLKQKNDLNKNDNKQLPISERMKTDFKMGTYISIITGNPIEIEGESNFEPFSLRQLFIQDFLASLKNEQIVLKKYRLLLPLESSCLLFWKGLKEKVSSFIKQHRNENSFIKNLRTRYGAANPIQPDLFETDLSTDKSIEDLTISLLTFLNSEAFLLVFWHTTPLFNLPLIAINPAEFKNAKIYVLLDTERELPLIHKYSANETMAWRFFVWDRIKTKQYAGKRIDFLDCLNNIADY